VVCMPRPLSLPDSYDPSAAKAARRNPPLYLPLRALSQRDQRGDQHALQHAVQNTLNLHFIKALDEFKKATKYAHDELRSIHNDWRFHYLAELQIIVTPMTNEVIYHHRTPQEKRVPYDSIDFRAKIKVPYYEQLSRTAINYLNVTLSHVVLMAARVYGVQGPLIDVNDFDKMDSHALMFSYVVLSQAQATESKLPLRVLHELYVPKTKQYENQSWWILPSILEFARSLPKLGTQQASSFRYNVDIENSEPSVHNPKRQGWGVVYTFEWPWCCPDSPPYPLPGTPLDFLPGSSSEATNQPPSLKRTHSNALAS